LFSSGWLTGFRTRLVADQGGPVAPFLDYVRQDRRVTLILNRPERHNVIAAADLPEFAAVLDAIEADPTIGVVVVTGRGAKSFSAGFDIGNIATTDWDRNPLETVVDRLEALPMPTICALNGSVYGGATDLAIACDFRIGVSGMRLRVPAAQLGVFYYVNGLKRFVERVGPAAARRIFLLGDELDAETLRAIGYLDRLVEPEALAPATDALARQLAEAAPLAVSGMKRALVAIGRGTLDEAAARQEVIRCFRSEDAQEGARAFAEKRPPRFVGR
jgi:enoyl-CoA hydratase/carnithine racemase